MEWGQTEKTVLYEETIAYYRLDYNTPQTYPHHSVNEVPFLCYRFHSDWLSSVDVADVKTTRFMLFWWLQIPFCFKFFFTTFFAAIYNVAHCIETLSLFCIKCCTETEITDHPPRNEHHAHGQTACVTKRRFPLDIHCHFSPICAFIWRKLACLREYNGL